jgi:hypothetical protein
MIVLKVLATVFVLWLVLVLPQVVDNAINALPQPLPQIIGVAMLAGVVTVFIAVINKLMKGTN